jgi:glucose-1-phosphate cytidylyltransferase
MSSPTPASEIPVVILCGGFGTRIREASERVPKPMIDIGGQPVLWHIMKTYSLHGHRRFVLCLGYMSGTIKDYFLRYRENQANFTISLANSDVAYHENAGGEDWEITCVETGLETGTGGRVSRIRDFIDTDEFMLTYGDGVSDVDVTKLLATHREQGLLGTVTGVHPTSRFGEILLDGDRVEKFQEKPELAGGWVSGGFFVFQREFLDRIDDDVDSLEKEPLSKLSADGQLAVHKHTGFWMGMDTFREYTELNRLWDEGSAPWRLWND